MRFAYDGSHFGSGYARQPDGDTVEDAMVHALRSQGYVEGSWRTGSRTDKGVHAAENVAACRLDRPHLKGLVPATQSALPDGVWMTGVAPVSADWNPRHAASRTYEYYAMTEVAAAAVHDACTAFEGTHDMSAFARPEDRDPKRTVLAFAAAAIAGGIRFTVTGRSFLWNQVRRMVDAVLAVGAGRATVADIQTSLTTGVAHDTFDRAIAEGLLLRRVDYDPPLAWQGEAVTPRRQWQDAQACARIFS